MNSVYKALQQLVAVDCIIFCYEENALKLLLFRRGIPPSKGEWSLIGGWVKDDESIETAAERILYHINGLNNIFLEQVHVFSEPNRDPGGRVISIALYALIDINKHDKNLVRERDAHWWPITQKPVLIFDHNKMVEKALEKLQFKASYQLIGRELLPENFTLMQLRSLYDAIFNRKFDPGNFRKKVLSLNVLEKLNIKNTTESKKGAHYYRFKKDIDLKAPQRIVKI